MHRRRLPQQNTLLHDFKVHSGCAGPVPNLMQAVLWMWPAMYRSIYGRFLLLQLDSASIVAVLSVLLSILSVASRLCSRKACRLS